ncbi:MAG: hypothetical protein FD149_2771 [Rhodospirillaceae bacterium]|nr:MAG: hypothetical protein FD149_2771 [Rhodospirillaceae bacterium]
MPFAVAFDTLKLARKLEAAGFEHQQMFPKPWPKP